MAVKLQKRQLEYGDITGMNVLNIISDRSHLHVWHEQIGGRDLIVGYMFPEEVPGVRLAPPAVTKNHRVKQSDGGMFNIPPEEPDLFPPLTPEQTSDTQADRAFDAAMREVK